MELGLKGKVVLVTGGSKGIGLACALAFAAEGARIGICSRSRDNMDKASAEIKEAFGVVADLVDAVAAERVIETVEDRLGPIDILVNSAGAAKRSPPDDLNPAVWREAFDAKFFSYINVIDPTVKRMAKRGSGVIVSIIGGGGRVASSTHLAGGSANAALMLATAPEALAKLLLRECCGYAVSIAGKLPDFQVAATREILKRTSELNAELARVLDVVGSMRQHSSRDGDDNFETQYRRTVSQRLDRMQLFGVRLVGAGAREPEISVAYVTLTSTQAKGAPARAVDETLAGHKRIVIRGEAGSGKTTLLEWLAIRAACRDFIGPLAPWNSLMPMYISLRDFVDGEFPPPEKFVASVAPNLVGLMPKGWPQSKLKDGALVLIDGIDEVPVARRGQLLDWLRGLIVDFPDAVYVVSSRPAALDARQQGPPTAERLSNMAFEQITLEPMSLRDSEALISQWYRSVARDLVKGEQRARLEQYRRYLIRSLRDRPTIRGLASNPLLCSMICTLNWDRQQRLPENRMQLYGLAFEMLMEARDADRGVKAARLAELDAAAKVALLDGIAYWMMRNGATEGEREKVEDQVGMMLQRLSKIPQRANEVLQELLERSGVLRQPQVGVIDFIHRTFLEYMAARAAVVAGDLGLLADNAKEDNWRERPSSSPQATRKASNGTN